jgi:tRNA A37 threonylcarbamoyladenosine synthetase subunit TsaC/SUA5/YrdC
LPGDALPMTDASEIRERLQQLVDAVVDGGNCGLEPTTVIDLAGEVPAIVRRGRGATDVLERQIGDGQASRV